MLFMSRKLTSTIYQLIYLHLCSSFCRYNTSSCDVDFLGDGDLNTLWQAEDGMDRAVVTVGLSAPLSISKVFVQFESMLPLAALLQFLPEESTEWRDLQYFADNCSTRFDMINNAG